MGQRILVADDSHTIRKVVELTFADTDTQVVTVQNGDLALQKIREIRPDIIMLDVIMPGKDGYEVCEFVKAEPSLSAIPVLLMAGSFEPFDKERALRVGSDGFLAKPFDSRSLVTRVRELMESKKPAPAPARPEPAIPKPAPEVVEPARPAAAPPSLSPDMTVAFTPIREPRAEAVAFEEFTAPPAPPPEPIPPPEMPPEASFADLADDLRDWERQSLGVAKAPAPPPPPPPEPPVSPVMEPERPVAPAPESVFDRTIPLWRVQPTPVAEEKPAPLAEIPLIEEVAPEAQPIEVLEAAVPTGVEEAEPLPLEEVAAEPSADTTPLFVDLMPEAPSAAAPAEVVAEEPRLEIIEEAPPPLLQVEAEAEAAPLLIESMPEVTAEAPLAAEPLAAPGLEAVPAEPFETEAAGEPQFPGFEAEEVAEPVPAVEEAVPVLGEAVPPEPEVEEIPSRLATPPPLIELVPEAMAESAPAPGLEVSMGPFVKREYEQEFAFEEEAAVEPLGLAKEPEPVAEIAIEPEVEEVPGLVLEPSVPAVEVAGFAPPGLEEPLPSVEVAPEVAVTAEEPPAEVEPEILPIEPEVVSEVLAEPVVPIETEVVQEVPIRVAAAPPAPVAIPGIELVEEQKAEQALGFTEFEIPAEEKVEEVPAKTEPEPAVAFEAPRIEEEAPEYLAEPEPAAAAAEPIEEPPPVAVEEWEEAPAPPAPAPELPRAEAEEVPVLAAAPPAEEGIRRARMATVPDISKLEPLPIRLDALPPEMIDAIARRVVAMLSEKVIEEIAWEVVPDLAEILVKKEIERLEKGM
ncbi:MAG: response regulator [Acidobacteriota bacterium]